jgi:hypothetical protein
MRARDAADPKLLNMLAVQRNCPVVLPVIRLLAGNWNGRWEQKLETPRRLLHNPGTLSTACLYDETRSTAFAKHSCKQIFQTAFKAVNLT